MTDEEIDGGSGAAKTVSIEAYRIEASGTSSVLGNITLNIHCAGSPDDASKHSQMKITGGEFTVSDGAVLNFTAENYVNTPFTNARTLNVNSATINVKGGTFTVDSGTESIAAVTNLENNSVLTAGALWNAKSKSSISVTDSTFVIGTWNGDNLVGEDGDASNKGSISIKTTDSSATLASFRAGAITNNNSITVDHATFKAASLNNSTANTYAAFTNHSTVSISGTVSNFGKNTQTEGDDPQLIPGGILIQDSTFEVTGSVTNRATFTVDSATIDTGDFVNNTSDSTLTVDNSEFNAASLTNSNAASYAVFTNGSEVSISGTVSNSGRNTQTEGDDPQLIPGGILIQDSTFEVGTWDGDNFVGIRPPATGEPGMRCWKSTAESPMKPQSMRAVP